MTPILCAAGCAGFGWTIFDSFDYALKFAAFGGVGGLAMSLLFVRFIVRPSQRVLDFSLAAILAVGLLMAFGGVAWMTGDLRMFVHGTYPSLLLACPLLGALTFIRWRHEDVDTARICE